MRSEDEMIAQILDVANKNEKVRAVLLTGSRANPLAAKDILQDFDVIYIVEQIASFKNDKRWIDIFGDRIILQLPDEMTVGKKDDHAFHYLMLFKDHTRIDLTLFPLEKFDTEFTREGFATVLLDKDDLFKRPGATKYIDFAVARPTEKEFLDCCNEFWWVSPYVAKGLYRDEITYAKHMMEIPLRNMFLKIIEWHIGSVTGFTASPGIGGRHLRRYVAPGLYDKILATYPNGDSDNIWASLFLMTNVFDDLARKIAASMKFQYNVEESKNVTEYLSWIHNLTTQKEKAGRSDRGQLES